MDQARGLLDDADEYVNSVMSSMGSALLLRTPLPSGRKRCLSAPDGESEIKKPRNGNDKSGSRQVIKARRNLLNLDTNIENQGESSRNINVTCEEDKKGNGKGPINPKNKQKVKKTIKTKSDQRKDKEPNEITDRAEIHQDTDVGIKDILIKMSDDMHNMQYLLNRRMDMIELKIEQSENKMSDKIIDKITKTFDKRISSESVKIRKDIDNKLSDLRKEFDSELAEISKKLDKKEANKPGNRLDETYGIANNIVIHGLPETVTENMSVKVDTLIKDGLKVRDVTVLSAVRKLSRVESKPGLVIATLRSSSDKKKVMMAKKSLMGHRSYDRVFINHDQTRHERNVSSNMRRLVDAVKRGDGSVEIRGSRVISSRGSSNTYRNSPDKVRERDNNNSQLQHNHASDASSSSRSNYNARQYGNARDNSQWRHESDDTTGSSNDNQSWGRAGRDGRHTGRYTRQGNWRRDNC